ncbi:unnamed protein product, partial [marine sediment metagenome]
MLTQKKLKLNNNFVKFFNFFNTKELIFKDMRTYYWEWQTNHKKWMNILDETMYNADILKYN